MTTASRSRPHKRRSPFLPFAVVSLAVLGTALSSSGFGQESGALAGASTLDGVFTQEQVDRIASTYQRSCSECHASDLGGSAMAPPLKGPPFMFFWQGKPLSELYTFLHDYMPLGNAGSLSNQAYADLVALILDANGFPAGDSELVPDVEALAGIAIAPAPATGGE